jgi:hypothetical protein
VWAPREGSQSEGYSAGRYSVRSEAGMYGAAGGRVLTRCRERGPYLFQTQAQLGRLPVREQLDHLPPPPPPPPPSPPPER